MARLKHSVALQLLHDLRETNPIIGIVTSLDIDNEEEYPGHPPPFSPHTECDNEDCRQVMLENVAIGAFTRVLWSTFPTIVHQNYDIFAFTPKSPRN